MTRSVRSSTRRGSGRTTPPRPLDIRTAFPELAFLARSATRLHPRPGAPGVADSSVGGPLLWPADEPWPHCHSDHGRATGLHRPADERARRHILAGVWGRTRPGDGVRFTDEERMALEKVSFEVPGKPVGPVPLLPIAQLYRHDIPGWFAPLRSPEEAGQSGYDVAQVLWCPFRHAAHDGGPAVMVQWREAASVRAVGVPEEPELMEGDGYLPEPCVLHPEEVVEYPYVGELPRGLYERIGQWEDTTGHRYHYDLSIADGWKVGGWTSWSLTEPHPIRCVCGESMRLLLTVAGSEWTGTGSWRPLEDEAATEFREFPPRSAPTMVTIGRGYRLYVFVCEESAAHPCRTVMQ
jgi:hypothetical protein